MSREVLGLVVLDLAFVCVGQALLAGLGLVRSPRESIRFAGLALVSGWAVTGVGLSLALALGAPFRWYIAVALWAFVLAVACAAATRRPPVPWPSRRDYSSAGRLVGTAAASLLVLYVIALLVRSAKFDGGFHPDVWNFWLPKAKIIYFFHGLAGGQGGFTSQVSPDYPPLDPILDALSFDAMGHADVLLLPAQHVVVAAAFLSGVAALLAHRVRPSILFPGLAALALMPGWGQLAGSCLADESLSIILGTAGVLGALWLLQPQPWLLVLCGLFLVAAALDKNEGLMLGVALVVALTAASRRIAAGATVLAAMLLAVLVWRIWLHVHHVAPNSAYHLSNALHPVYLLQHASRLSYGGRQLLMHLSSPSQWLALPPLALAAALAAGRPAKRLVTLLFVTVALGVLGFASIYWTSSLDIHYYVDNSVSRLVSTLAVLGALIFPLVLAEAAPARPDPPRRLSLDDARPSAP
jgi:hypothetical protein